MSDKVSYSIAPGSMKYCLESLAGYTAETVLSGFSSISQGGVTHSLESLGGYTVLVQKRYYEVSKYPL